MLLSQFEKIVWVTHPTQIIEIRYILTKKIDFSVTAAFLKKIATVLKNTLKDNVYTQRINRTGGHKLFMPRNAL